MQELIKQLIIYARGIWHYRWYAMMFAWVIVVIGWVMVARMPDQYQSSARVYVDTQTILGPLLKGLAVQTNATDRVRLMTRTLLSRPSLEKVARMTDMDIRVETPEQMESLLDGLANTIEIGSMRREENLYTIAYQHEDPQVAKGVVQSLLTIFVEDTLGETRQESDAAQKFLDKQIKEYEAKLVEAEAKLTAFKRKHVGVLPRQSGNFFESLQEAQAQLESAKLQLQEEQYRRDELEMQLEEVEDDIDPMPMPETPVVAQLDQRIQKMQTMLDEMLLRYTEHHPDVQEIKATIATLDEQRQGKLEAIAANPPSNQANDRVMYQQIQMNLRQADANLASARVRVKEFKGRVAKLKNLVNTQPQVEIELKTLNRDYDVNKKNYLALVERRESARISEDVGQSGNELSFKIVDPPRVPLAPSGPDRLLFSSVVLLAGMGIGLALALFLSQLRPLVYDRHTLREITGLPVFGTVSRVWLPGALLKVRLEVAALFFTGLVLVAAYGAVIWMHGEGIGVAEKILQFIPGSFL